MSSIEGGPSSSAILSSSASLLSSSSSSSVTNAQSRDILSSKEPGALASEDISQFFTRSLSCDSCFSSERSKEYKELCIRFDLPSADSVLSFVQKQSLIKSEYKIIYPIQAEKLFIYLKEEQKQECILWSDLSLRVLFILSGWHEHFYGSFLNYYKLPESRHHFEVFKAELEEWLNVSFVNS